MSVIESEREKIFCAYTGSKEKFLKTHDARDDLIRAFRVLLPQFFASDQLLTADLDGQVMAPEAVGFSLMAEDIRRDRVVYEVLHRFHMRPVNFTSPVIHFAYSPIPEQQQ
ncbi:hypothetical protein RUM44_012653 [Polyplax serrata]|uniref:Uncharacterized protein n=1 Tax=Polyplax serrata TaxID=468196 RepID=A0ABR1BGB0_POLSC